MKDFIIFSKMLLSGLLTINSQYDISVIEADKAPADLSYQLRNFESNFAYPLNNNEQFKVQHGNNGDYFEYFKKLGKPYYFIAKNSKTQNTTKTINGTNVAITIFAGEIAGTGCAVLRRIKNKASESINAWYFCDLKIHEKYQGEHLPLLIMQKVLAGRFFQCTKGFGICINPLTGGESKAAAIFKKHGPALNLNTQILNIYTLNEQKVNKLYFIIKDMLKKYGYMLSNEELTFVSTKGIKDHQIYGKLNNSSYPWELFHIKSGKTKSIPQKSGTYMICSVEGSPLDNDFRNIFVKPTFTAQIISYGMNDVDFNFLTTDQI